MECNKCYNYENKENFNPRVILNNVGSLELIYQAIFEIIS